LSKTVKAVKEFNEDAPIKISLECVEDILELLKEQEPVAPVMVPHSRGIAYNCGACGTEIAVIRDTISAGWAKENVRYCQRCGRAVNWDD
jgi:hypothetical protein